MKVKKLPTHFRRACFDWEIVERKKVLVGVCKIEKEFIYKDWGLFRQDKHWAVAEIFLVNPHPNADNQLEWDKLETIPGDYGWGGANSRTYMPGEEHLARKEYESKG